MTNIFTIGTNGKTPKKFFELIKSNNIDLILDIRLNNKSQLAGFAKGGDDYLGYLLDKITKIKYIHDPDFAPTEAILDQYHKDKNWNNYVKEFKKIIIKRDIKNNFILKYGNYKNVCLLCSEETSEQCHRRLVAEAIVEKSKIKHL